MDPIREEEDEVQLPKNPKEAANCFSSLFFVWMNKILNQGSKRTLQTSDLFPLMEEDSADILVSCMATEWKEEWDKCQKENKKPQLWKSLLRAIPSKDYAKLVVLCFFSSATFVGLLLIVWFFLLYLMESNANNTKASLFIVGIGVLSFVRALCVHHGDYFCEIWGMRLKVAIIGLVYKKILVSTRHGLEKGTSGNTVNLVSNDAAKMERSVFALGMLISAVFEILASICVLSLLIGWKALVGAGFFVLVVVYIVLVARNIASLHSKASIFTDSRLALMNEIISGIRTIKMYTLEWTFAEQVKYLRGKEIGLIRLKGVILSSFMALYNTTTATAVLISIAVMITTGIHLQAFQIFTLLMGLNVMKFAICVYLADAFRYINDTRISLQRVQTFLDHDTEYPSAEEIQEENKINTFSFDNMVEIEQEDSGSQKQENSSQGAKYVATKARAKSFTLRPRSNTSNNISSFNTPSLKITDLTCSWTDSFQPNALNQVSMKATNNELVVITGSVGSGKTSLLLAILEELPLSNGQIKSLGKIAYVSQSPWVFSGTVRENILFGRPYNPLLYKKVLESCDLTNDLSRFHKGDMTRLGQRGASMSGGQRARVSLARALYSEANIYLLDDPLSAVDARVCKVIFERCICGMLSQRLRLLVTHHVQYIKAADHVIVLERGLVVHQGRPVQLKDKLGDFLDMRKDAGISASLAVSEVIRRPRKKSSISGAFEVVQDSAMVDKEQEEERETGAVTLSLYWAYFRAGLHPLGIIALMILFAFAQVCMVAPSWWLSQIANMSPAQQQEPQTLGIFAAMAFIAFVMTTLAAYSFLYSALGAAKTLHNRMTTAAIKAPAAFFDDNPAGRILNRFSKDIGLMDDLLPVRFLRALLLSLGCITSLLIPIASNYWLILAMAPLVAVLIYYGRFFMKSSREFKRLEAISCSPVYSHVSETVLGIEIIRSSNTEVSFLKQFYRYQDENTQAFFMVVSSARWMAVRLEMLCSVFIVAVAAGALLIGESPALAGLSITFAMETLGASQYVVRLVAQVENLMTSVERVIGYTKLEQEPGYSIDTAAPESWPQQGRIELENLTLTYVKDGIPVLRDISASIAAKEKIGIVGRTGAGKSSIVSALFRMPDPEGKVLIDGVDIGTLNLQEARRSMAVITQDPVLFAGSLRMNLDPFSQWPDSELWDALEQVQIKDAIQELPGKLNYPLKESGANLSVGQRQILCLARALLQKSKIIVMDEATANVDFKTDRIVQDVIQSQFQDCTVLTIAHRLHTIMDYDKVMVLNRGRVVEFDKPKVLLENMAGYFTEIVNTYKESTR